MKKIQIELEEKTVERINELYTQQKDGIKTAVENWIVIQQSTLGWLKGKFSKEELTVLVDMHNGTMYDSRFTSPKMLAVHIEEAEQYESTCTRHGADMQKLLNKVAKIGWAESLVLIEECFRFWEKGESIESFIERMG